MKTDIQPVEKENGDLPGILSSASPAPSVPVKSQKAEKNKEKLPKTKEERKPAFASASASAKAAAGLPASAARHNFGDVGGLQAGREKEIEVKNKSASQGFSLENLSVQGGELTVDLYQNEEELIIRSAVAGVKPEKLDILIEQDIIAITGSREEPEEKEKIHYFSRECYFGPFSRKIISPVEIDPSRAKATIKEGILFIRIPRIHREKKVKLGIEKE